jgi:hypothetical protein
VRAPTRPHPEAANLPPFNETTFAAAKQVDVALDQARMPSLVPTAGGPAGCHAACSPKLPEQACMCIVDAQFNQSGRHCCVNNMCNTHGAMLAAQAS